MARKLISGRAHRCFTGRRVLIPESSFRSLLRFGSLPRGLSAIAVDKQQKNIYAVTMGVPMVLRIPIKEDGSAGEPKPLQPSGHSLLDALQLDPRDKPQPCGLFQVQDGRAAWLEH